MRQKQFQFPVLPLVITVLLLAVTLVMLSISRRGGDEGKVSLEAGLAYLEMREAGNPDEVKQIRKAMEKAKLAQQRDAMIEELTSGSKDPFSMFKDYMIMGDSRAVGFWYHKFLDKANVIADGGHTIRDMQKNLDKVVAASPATVYLCYGLNDVSIGYWDTKEAYVAEYISTIQDLQKKLPGTKVVVSSILPTTDVAFRKSGKWRNIPEWSAALEAACRENGILFSNCDNLFAKYPNLWDPVDGIHFRKEFYPYWASSLIVTTLMEENG